MGFSEKVRPVVLAGAIGLSHLVASGAPILAESSQKTDIALVDSPHQPEKSEAKRILDGIRPSLYKLKLIPKKKGLPVQYCTGAAVRNKKGENVNTLVTAWHCGRLAKVNGRLIQAIDEHGYPLYDMIAYQEDKSVGEWKMEWIPPQNTLPRNETKIDIGLWRLNRPMPTALSQGDPSTFRAGEHLFIGHYPGWSNSPKMTEGIVIDAPTNFLTMSTWNDGGLTDGSSGGVHVRPDLTVMATYNTHVRRGERFFVEELKHYGILNDGNTNALLYASSVQGLSRFGY